MSSHFWTGVSVTGWQNFEVPGSWSQIIASLRLPPHYLRMREKPGVKSDVSAAVSDYPQSRVRTSLNAQVGKLLVKIMKRDVSSVCISMPPASFYMIEFEFSFPVLLLVEFLNCYSHRYLEVPSSEFTNMQLLCCIPLPFL